MASYEITAAGKRMTVDIHSLSKMLVDGNTIKLDVSANLQGISQITVNGQSYGVYCKKTSETGYDVYLGEDIVPIEIEDHRAKLIAQVETSNGSKSGVSIVRAPMPGLVTAIEVNTGDIVEPGTGLIVLEAMKMENEIRSTIRGKIKAIEVKPKTTIEKNQILIRIEELP